GQFRFGAAALPVPALGVQGAAALLGGGDLTAHLLEFGGEGGEHLLGAPAPAGELLKTGGELLLLLLFPSGRGIGGGKGLLQPLFLALGADAVIVQLADLGVDGPDLTLHPALLLSGAVHRLLLVGGLALKGGGCGLKAV